MTCYKLLDRQMRSYGDCQWTLGEWKESDKCGELWSGGYYAYEHPLLAVLHNSYHVSPTRHRLFVAEAGGKITRDGQLRLKAQRMRILREIPVPTVKTVQRVAYAILCAKAVYRDREWNAWADRWLSGEDRSRKSAQAIEERTRSLSEKRLAEWLAGEPTGRAVALAAAQFASQAAGWRRVSEPVVRTVELATRVAWAARKAQALDLIACAEAAMSVVESAWSRERATGRVVAEVLT